MRKSNSIFKTAFVSEAGAALANNDYFAYVEDDDYACYVLAAGITDFETSEAAKLVVENLILSFEENPTMSKSTLLRYMRETNERLVNSNQIHRLKASVIMLVTDYEKFRYVSAGNVRLRMYRSGRFFLKSEDMSLANDLIKRGETETPLDKHDERHNLYAYLGKRGGLFKPYVSSTQKLADADILALYTQGLWEHVDEQEIDEIFADATDEPQESVNNLEDLLLSRQPEDLKSYTVAAIFVNKVFTDPERERKRALYIKIAVIVLVILLIGAIIFYIWQRYREDKVQTMNEAIQQANISLDSENYTRARDQYQKALEMAQDLHRDEESKVLSENLEVLDFLIKADEFFTNGKYQEAYDNYLRVFKYSGDSYKEIQSYAQRRLDAIETRLDMQQFMALGDHLFQLGNYDEAEKLYMKAIEKSVAIHDPDGRDKATAALDKVYDKRAELRKDAEQKLENKRQAAITDALNRGDDLLAAGDIDGAQKAYLDARNLSDNPTDRAQTSSALMKITDAREKKAAEERTTEEEKKRNYDDAVKTETKGDEAFAAGDYVSAEVYYLTAIEKFTHLNEQAKVRILHTKYDRTKIKEEELNAQSDTAQRLEDDARIFYMQKNYEEARVAATQAKEVYKSLGLQTKVEAIDVLLQQIALDKVVSDSVNP